MRKEKDWIDVIAAERSTVDPAFAALSRRADMMLKLLPIRKRLGLTQEDMAKRMGVSRAIVAITESRPQKVSLDRIAAYAEALGAKVELCLPTVRKRRAKKSQDESEGYLA
jgi:transcriptional regulator with XRE-family HTH domain